MSSRRTAKIAQAVLETVSTSILTELRDPRVKNVTVLHVDLAPDGRSAKVYVSVMGDEREQALCLHGLESARGFLQSRIADRVQLRWVPVLRFVLDQSIKRSFETERLLREVLPPTDAEPSDAASPDAEPPAGDGPDGESAAPPDDVPDPGGGPPPDED